MYAIRPYLLLVVIAIIIGAFAGAAPAVYKPILTDQGLSSAQHRMLLAIIDSFLTVREGKTLRHTEMYQAVRDLLGQRQSS